MWIKTQGNRLVNLDKIESIDLVSRRETTAGHVVYELIARPGGGQTTSHVFARFTEEAPGQKVFQDLTRSLQSGATLFEIPPTE